MTLPTSGAQLLSLLLLLAVGAGGCATAQKPSAAGLPEADQGSRRAAVQLDALRIVVEQDPLVGLDGYDAADLFGLAYNAFEAGDYPRASHLYAKLVGEFPASSLVAAAQWNGALALEKDGQLKASVAALAAYAGDIEPADPSEGARARLRAATTLLTMGNILEAGDLLERIDPAAPAIDLDLTEGWELRILLALLQGARGSDDYAEAELNRIRRSIRRESLQRKERFPYVSAMVWYGAGHLYRLRASAVSLDAVDDLDLLDEALGNKARLLLEARQHFRRSLRHGIAAWSGPAALELGAVYTDFRDDLIAAPTPSALSAEASRVYEELVARRTRRFIEASIDDYQDILEHAVALQLEPAWMDAIAEALQRCRDELSRVGQTP